MKNRSSRFLKGMGWVYLSFPFSFPFLSAIVFNLEFSSIASILLTPFFYLLALLCTSVGYGLLNLTRSAYPLFLISQPFLLYENLNIVVNYSHSPNKVIALALSTLGYFVISYRIHRELYVPYLYPRTRWWETNPQYKFKTPIRITRISQNDNRTEVIAELLDVSVLGGFLKTLKEFNIDEELFVEFTAFGFSVRTRATVFWKFPSTVTHPKGIGIKFNSLSKNHKRALRGINRKMSELTKLYRSGRYFETEENLEKSLRGFHESCVLLDSTPQSLNDFYDGQSKLQAR